MDQTETKMGTGADIAAPVEADTAVTQDPDTTTYHDMTL